MSDKTLKPLPLGTSDFETLRMRGQIYVDKTALIYVIAKKTEKFFLTRPRRFGKSLLVSTFASLFKNGLKFFSGLAVCFRNFVNLGPSNGNIGLDMGLSVGSLAGSALISIIVIKARHWFHAPHQCITIPSVIPMVPGVLMYRALFAFLDMHGVVGELTIGMTNAIRASLAIICIALGVAIPNIFFRRFIADERKKRLLDMLVERKRKNGEFVDLHEVDVK